MNDPTPLLNIGDLAKPATVLIEKISDAIGGVFKPWQIRRVAHAESEANKIKAAANIEISDLQQRAMRRFFVEEAKKQSNIESIIAQSLPQLDPEADPTEIEDDWISNFFDRCRLISDQEMQSLWSKVLAGEANTPGKFSKRTINFLGSLDQKEADFFTSLCCFSWNIGNTVPLIFDLDDEIYKQPGIHFNSLKHLDEIGLITFDSGTLSGYLRNELPPRYPVSYFSTELIVEFKERAKNSLEVGCVLLSQTGDELASICGSKPVPGFIEYVVSRWAESGAVVSSEYSQ